MSSGARGPLRLSASIRWVAASAAVLVWGPLAPGQGPALTGVVTYQGQPVQGATVALRCGVTGRPLASLSNRGGVYTFSGVAPATDCEVWAAHEGLASTARPFRISGPGEKLTIGLALTSRIQFEEISRQAGLRFTLRTGATGRFYQPEIMTGGVAAFDFDGDGCTDIFFVNGAELPAARKTGPEYHNRLFRNDCRGAFTDVTASSGLEGTGYGMGVATADYDNDGRPDVFVAGLHGNTLYRNKGGGRFEDVTAHAGLVEADRDRRWAVAAGWFDYDNDGWLDLFASNYVVWEPAADAPCNLDGKPYYCHPRVYQGLPNQLFHNNRDGTFTDVSRASGVGRATGKGMGVAFGDFNGDGRPDVFAANDSVPNFLFENLGNGTFREVAMERGVAYAFHGKAVAGMGADFRDMDEDGRDDIVLSAMYFDTFPLYRNSGTAGGFEDRTVASGLAAATRNLTGWSLGLYDFDNDGRKDLFVAASHFPGSEPYAGADAALPNHVFRALGGGAFEDVSRLAGTAFQEPALHHGAAFADFDNDGRIDAVVTASGSPAKLFRNVSPPAHWIALRLTGTRSNRDGLGARVRLTLPTGQILHNHATTSVGYGCSSEPLVRFGLGPYDRAREITIRWPAGREQRLADIMADRIIEVREQ